MSALVEFELEDARRVIVRPMDISHAVDHWLGELERKGESERTVDTYRRFLHKLADAHPTLDIGDVTAAHIRHFLDRQSQRRDGKRKAKATIAQQVTIVNNFFDWITFEAFITRNPTRRNGMRIIARPRLIAPEDNDNVITVSTGDVELMMAAADKSTSHKHYWARRLAVYVAPLAGSRRRALSNLRITDYDPVERTLKFGEKGGVPIEKPIPDELVEVINEAIKAGVYADQDYLIPSRASQRRPGDRDDRIIWHLVRDVAEDVGIKTHVHALRAAFAVQYLETHPGQSEALMKLMGHKRPETTQVYLRRLNRRKSMETVRDLSFRSPQNAAELLEAKGVAEKEGFEPSFEPLALLDSVRREHAPAVPGAGAHSGESTYPGSSL